MFVFNCFGCCVGWENRSYGRGIIITIIIIIIPILLNFPKLLYVLQHCRKFNQWWIRSQAKFTTTCRKHCKNIYCNILQYAIEFLQLYCILQYAINVILLHCIFIECPIIQILFWFLDLNSYSTFLVLKVKILSLSLERSSCEKLFLWKNNELGLKKIILSQTQ